MSGIVLPRTCARARPHARAHARARARAASGFSLVELVVVIGLIALLVALLLPSLGRAREQANRTKCMNNLRQIGVALFVYVGDFGDYPVLDAAGPRPTETTAPLFYAARRSGLLGLRTSHGFERYNLACPDGWASQGDGAYYQTTGIASNGAAFMDYAYWPWRYPVATGPGAPAFDVRTASLRYRQEKRDKIVVSDVVTDLGSMDGKALATVGQGNHGSNHSGGLVIVPRTDGQGHRLGSVNRIQGSGASVLFSDGRVVWFDVTRLTQQADGICYPPVDQW